MMVEFVFPLKTRFLSGVTNWRATAKQVGKILLSSGASSLSGRSAVTSGMGGGELQREIEPVWTVDQILNVVSQSRNVPFS